MANEWNGEFPISEWNNFKKNGSNDDKEFKLLVAESFISLNESIGKLTRGQQTILDYVESRMDKLDDRMDKLERRT